MRGFKHCADLMTPIYGLEIENLTSRYCTTWLLKKIFRKSLNMCLKHHRKEQVHHVLLYTLEKAL